MTFPRSILTALVALMALAPVAGASVQAVPMSDPHTPVTGGQAVTTAFTTTDAVTLDLNQNGNSWTATVSDGSVCVVVNPRRGVVRRRCTLPAGGAVVYTGPTFTSGGQTFTTASTPTSPSVILASVDYLTTTAPFVPTVYTITCDWKMKHECPGEPALR